MTESDESASAQPAWFGAATALLGVAAVAATALIGARFAGAGPAAVPAPVVAADDLCRRVDDAYLSGTLYGALERPVEWRGTDMRCTGGPRPGGRGVRLVFAAPMPGGTARLVFVIGISGAIDELTMAERAANVTVIDESSGRFFSSAGRDRCWTTVASVENVGEHVQIGGEVYCAGSLPSLSDGGSISLRDFRYSGRLARDAS